MKYLDPKGLLDSKNMRAIDDTYLKVRQFQNEFMKSSSFPKYERKIVRISALCSEGRNPDILLFVFWEKR